MRKVLVSLLLALTALTGAAQTVGEAIYFYRNDGGFNAFFRADIDSITYTTIAGDSTATDVIMVQNIHTPDSTYEIPLNAIDSVSFVNPETIFQPDVIKMDAAMLSYLQAVDGMTLVFSSSMPSALRPKEGDILLSVDATNRMLSDGFAGRVTSVGETAGTLQVACARVEDVSDIFVQLIGVERIGDDQQQAQARRYSMGTGDIQKKTVTLPLNYDSEPLEDAEFALSGSLNGTVYGEYAYFFNLFNQVVDVTLYHEWDYSIGADFKIEKDFEWPSETSVFQEKTLFKFLFPLAAPVFKVELTGTPFVSAEGSIESAFNYQSRKYPYITRIKYEDKNGFQGSYTKPLKESGDENEPSFDAQISVKGSVMAGGKLGLSLGTIDFFGGYLRARADLAIGPKMEADIHLEGNTDNGWNNFYNAHKDNKLELGLVADIDIYGEAISGAKSKIRNLSSRRHSHRPLRGSGICCQRSTTSKPTALPITILMPMHTSTPPANVCSLSKWALLPMIGITVIWAASTMTTHPDVPTPVRKLITKCDSRDCPVARSPSDLLSGFSTTRYLSPHRQNLSR